MTTSVLTITLAKLVAYEGDISDPSQFATDPNMTTPNAAVTNFFVATLIGDITHVNSRPAKGTYFGRTRVVKSSPSALAGQAIADVSRIAMRQHFFEIINERGVAIGTIMSSGFAGGAAPPGTGAPAGYEGNWAITGGTGAYAGARGQVGGDASPRPASMTEDPSQRRMHSFTDPNHDGSGTFYLRVIPADPPEIMSDASGPRVLHHTNNTAVTTSAPAMAGETLLAFASGLGPTVPDVDLSIPFPAVPPSNVSSPWPLTVSVNGVSAHVIAAAGVPGEVNEYQILFQMPSTSTPPAMSLQLTAAWILGPRVNISVA